MGYFIMIYTGDTANIPEGFSLCDGTGGGPDLRNKFIKGVESDTATDANNRPGATGGSSTRSHSHGFSTVAAGYSHSHTLIDSSFSDLHPFVEGSCDVYHCQYIAKTGTSGLTGFTTTEHNHTTSTASIPSHTHTILSSSIKYPSYYVVMFIKSLIPPILPSGSIMMWSGAVSDIPSGWVFCDGTNSTPDMRNRFVMASTTNIGDTGGDYTHTHSGSANTHYHSCRYADVPTHTHADFINAAVYHGLGTHHHAYYQNSTSNGTHEHNCSQEGSHSHTVSACSTYASYPPYYNLAFIMRL